MKIIAILTIFLSLSLNAYALQRFYNAAGEDEYGTVLAGTLYSNTGEVLVYGALVDQDGNRYHFEGRWNGFAHVSGIVENDDWVELDTN